MKCHVCGAEMYRTVTDLPFKVKQDAIIILKGLPVWQCSNCQEYLIEDAVMAQVEPLLDKMGDAAELEVVRFAA